MPALTLNKDFKNFEQHNPCPAPRQSHSCDELLRKEHAGVSFSRNQRGFLCRRYTRYRFRRVRDSARFADPRMSCVPIAEACWSGPSCFHCSCGLFAAANAALGTWVFSSVRGESRNLTLLRPKISTRYSIRRRRFRLRAATMLEDGLYRKPRVAGVLRRACSAAWWTAKNGRATLELRGDRPRRRADAWQTRAAASA